MTSGEKPFHPPKNQRLSPEVYRSAGRVCFITIHAAQNTTPFVRNDLNQTVLDCLHEESKRQHCKVFTYCLMPDHMHFLVSPECDGVCVLAFTHRFKGKATNRSWEFGWRGRLWQPRFYDHIVRDDEELVVIDRYILDNPVRKGLVAHMEDWPWSGKTTPLPL